MLHFAYATMPGGALIHPILVEAHAFVKVTNVISHANFGGCTWKGLVSAKVQIHAFSY